MESDHWMRVKEILAEALDRPSEAREDFVRERCGGDDALLQDVLKLLDSLRRAGGALSQPLFPLTLPEHKEQPPQFLSSTLLAYRFRILRLIARGGMGDVYEAEDVQLGVRVALKTIRPEIAKNGRVLEMFKNEIQIARRVTHPNVCRIYDLAEHSETSAGEGERVTIFLTMELLAGEPLSEHLKTHGPFSRDEALPLIRQLASALQAAHEAGVIHRDLKPGNIILAPDANGKLRVSVTDFGLAVARTHAHSEPLPPAAGGTPDYMAPEQIGGGDVTAAADVYALGLVIAEMIGARVQAVAPTRRRSVFLRLASRPGPVTLNLPPAFQDWKPVLLRCLETEPAVRYSHPMLVAEALAGGTPGRPLPRLQAGAIAMALVAAILGLTAFLSQRYGGWLRTDAPTYRKLGPDDENIGLWQPSPDGRYFAMTDWKTGNLALRDILSGEIRLLTNKVKSPDEEQATFAVFSHDQSRIAYTWQSANGFELRINDTRTGADSFLYRDPASKFCIVHDWSPDNTRIVADCGEIALISVTDHSVSFPLPKGRYGNVLFAPGGDHIVFSAAQTAQSAETDIFESPLNGGPASVLVADPADDRIIGFSRDGRRLIFSSDREGRFGVWSVAFSGNLTAGEPTALAHDLGRAEVLGLTEDGALFYTVATDSIDVYTAEIGAAGGRLLSGPENVVKRFRGSFRVPSFSADGRWLAFMSRLDFRPRIWVYSRETGQVHFLDPQLASFARPQWDPSGYRIFVVGTDGSGRSGIFRVDATTGRTEMTIDQQTLQGMEGAWSSDGRTLFDRFSDPALGLFRMDTQTGRRQVLYVPPRNLSLGLENLALSPDEKTLAFQVRERAASSLMVISTDGGPAKTLLTITKPEVFQYGAFAWTADSKQILTVRTKLPEQASGSGPASELWLVSVDGVYKRRIDFPAVHMRQMRMSRDGRTIAFTAGETSGEVWVAENLLSQD